MEITWTGVVIIPLTLFLFVPFRLSKILKLSIFFLPFGVISVANFHSIPPFFGIGLDRYFTGILILSVILFSLFNKLPTTHLPSKIKYLLFLFVIAILTSWVVPVYFHHRITIIKYEPTNHFFYNVPLEFSITNITKTIELLFSIISFLCFFKTLPIISPKKLARIVVLSTFIVSISSLLDFLPGSFHIWGVLKNNISYSACRGIILGYFGEPRISGLAIEPSHLVIYTLYGLSIVIAYYKNGIRLFNKSVDLLLMITFVSVSILSFSPASLIGFSIVIMYLCYTKRLITILKGMVFLVVILITTFILTLVLNFDYLSVLYYNILGKLGITYKYGLYSEYRKLSFLAVWDTFLKAPILGVGWGSFNHQVGFPLLLLGSVGLIGTLIFLLLIIEIFKTGRVSISKSASSIEMATKEGFLLIWIIITIICCFTKSYFYFLHLPVVFINAAVCCNWNKYVNMYKS